MVAIGLCCDGIAGLGGRSLKAFVLPNVTAGFLLFAQRSDIFRGL
jgi:hypothetical protein